MPSLAETAIEEAGEILARADRIAILTGAGISAESGVPTFRGAHGLWNDAELQRLATPQGFARDPRAVWAWYSSRRTEALRCAPNPGHVAVAAMERELRARVTVVTQNVDGLHRRAGTTDLVEVHGSLFTTRCCDCPFTMEGDEREYGKPPRCPECGGRLRPGVVWFGEMLPGEALDRAGEAMDTCDVLLIVGTSAVVQPVAAMPLYARAHGARLIEVNPNPTPITSACDIAFALPSGQCLPRLLSVAQTRMSA